MKNYNEEIRAKINAVQTITISETATRVDTCIQEQKILTELDNELEFSRYDLEESDILRTLKILNVLESYPDVFKYQNALKIFYVLARLDITLATTLQEYCDLSRVEFKTITNAMIRNGLIMKNDHEELELTLDGKSLATRIGHDFF